MRRSGVRSSSSPPTLSKALIFKAFSFCSTNLDGAARQPSKFMRPNTQSSESIKLHEPAQPAVEQNGKSGRSTRAKRPTTRTLEQRPDPMAGCQGESTEASSPLTDDSYVGATHTDPAGDTTTFSAHTTQALSVDAPWRPRTGAHYLTRSANGIWYARLVIPPHIRAANPNLPREIRRSTRTAEKRLAATRARNICLDYFLSKAKATTDLDMLQKDQLAGC
jgi:hypothetical protein